MERPHSSLYTVLAGIALVIAGFSSADPLVLVGIALIVLGVVHYLRGRHGVA